VPWFVVVEQNHRLITKGIWVLATVVCERVMLFNSKRYSQFNVASIKNSQLLKDTYRPMLFPPEPLISANEVSANEVSTQTEHIVDPGFSRNGAVVGIVLYVQFKNESLGHTVNNRQSVGGSTKALKIKEKGNVRKGSEQVSSSSRLVSTSNNLEDFPLDLLLKGSIKLVRSHSTTKIQSQKILGRGSYSLDQTGTVPTRFIFSKCLEVW
jgi:hypothetical protein